MIGVSLRTNANASDLLTFVQPQIQILILNPEGADDTGEGHVLSQDDLINEQYLNPSQSFPIVLGSGSHSTLNGPTLEGPSSIRYHSLVLRNST